MKNSRKPLNQTDKAVLAILIVLVVIFVLLCVTLVDVGWDKAW